MAKHVFEISKFGSIYHWGEFSRETPAFTFSRKRNGREEKRSKLNVFYIETDTPDLILRQYQEAYRSHIENVRAHLNALREAEKGQSNAARQAIGLEPV